MLGTWAAGRQGRGPGHPPAVDFVVPPARPGPGRPWWGTWSYSRQTQVRVAPGTVRRALRWRREGPRPTRFDRRGRRGPPGGPRTCRCCRHPLTLSPTPPLQAKGGGGGVALLCGGLRGGRRGGVGGRRRGREGVPGECRRRQRRGRGTLLPTTVYYPSRPLPCHFSLQGLFHPPSRRWASPAATVRSGVGGEVGGVGG